MDSFNGYKLKPSSYQIHPNDIIIRVIGGSPKMPNGQIAISLSVGEVKTYNKQSWTTVCYHWRAIETKPGSEAEAGDTVYCIKDTGGACQIHDSFIVNSTTKNYLYPIDNHILLNGTITNSCWHWWPENFVVLVKAEEKKQIQNIVSPENAKPGNYVIWDERDSSIIITTMTLGKAYKVLKTYETALAVKDNAGRSNLWSKSRFKNIDKIQQQQQQEETSTTNFIPFTIVDSKGNEKICIGLSEDNWYISKNSIGCRVLHNPRYWTKKEPIEFKVNISKDPSGHIQYIYLM